MSDDLFEREAMIGSRVAIAGFVLLVLVSTAMLLFTDADEGKVQFPGVGSHSQSFEPRLTSPGQVSRLDASTLRDMLDATGKLSLLPKNALVVIDFLDAQGRQAYSFGIVGTNVHEGELAEYDLAISIKQELVPELLSSGDFCGTLGSWGGESISVDFRDPLKAIRYLTFKKSCLPSIPMTGGAIAELPPVKRAVSAVIIWVILFTSAILVIKLRTEEQLRSARRVTQDKLQNT